ncbi:hypothetical protein KTR66_20540 [Roseococcus sp. SDR]|uniref:hypothetical protein n=1 Tax=Roseococcus sp. SDR TaxID=2835532 RepID=UPI001BCB2B81|nr:hypothetical protein [Roseococcus sp. SDR]MBS7792393.1 hypothetical protein [Roseococcus sp. SDR]MBV1847707.1 hypothetical protein [Roseococcus sp. SDR]
MSSGRVMGCAALLSLAFMAGAEAQTAVGGFYRQTNQNAVMFQSARDRYCQVQSESQMAAFGGFSKVTVVPRIAMLGQQTGACAWPNGFYRRTNETAVYRLYGVGTVAGIGTDICHVVNEQQMASFGGFRLVKVVAPTSDLGRGRGPVAPCNTRAG